MIIEHPCKKVDTHYFGKDAEVFLKEIGWEGDVVYLGKECTVKSNNKGIIIGIEDSNTFMDYYYIVYVPAEDKLYYELANSSEFVNTIIV